MFEHQDMKLHRDEGISFQHITNLNPRQRQLVASAFSHLTDGKDSRLED